MTSEPNSELNNVTPLSQARLSRKSTNQAIEINEDRLREILSEFVDGCLNAKFDRLETSINRMVNQFEAVRIGEAKDSALRVTTDLNASDIALSGINLPKEEYYPYTCSDLAKTLGVRNHDVTSMIKKLGLRNNITYHICIHTGRISKVNKWSEAALEELKKTLDLSSS